MPDAINPVSMSPVVGLNSASRYKAIGPVEANAFADDVMAGNAMRKSSGNNISQQMINATAGSHKKGVVKTSIMIQKSSVTFIFGVGDAVSATVKGDVVEVE